jgi:hypothetical protein
MAAPQHDNTASARTIAYHDTGQNIESELIELESIELAAFANEAAQHGDAAHNAESLAVTFHEIHRIDEVDGRRELITSTLKYFNLHVAVQADNGELLYHLDGTSLEAHLVYENGAMVDALSATLEPPLLAAAGECPPKATIEGGCATFRVRITVLSSLCNKQSFCVRVTSLERPELSVCTEPTKTITKLRRGAREPRASVHATDENGAFPGGGSCGSKRALSHVAATGEYERSYVPGCLMELPSCEMDEARLGCCVPGALSVHSLDELWDQVADNGARLLELQAQQRKLFTELRSLKQEAA